mgnify:CR=1 FL=1
MLSNRQLIILKAIVEEYVATAEPVGSKYLLNKFGFNFSSATIRNDMAILEELGLLQKTHTSSGRVPSEEGYRVYVKEMLREREGLDVSKEENFPLIDQILDRSASRERAIRESMALVTDLTNYASIVMGPSGYNAKIKKLQFISLSSRYAVILMVTDKGNVESKKIIIPEYINIKDVEKVIAYLNNILYDCPIADIYNRIKEEAVILINEELKNIIIENDSVIIFTKIYSVIVKVGPYLVILGIRYIMISNLSICSKTLLGSVLIIAGKPLILGVATSLEEAGCASIGCTGCTGCTGCSC